MAGSDQVTGGTGEILEPSCYSHYFKKIDKESDCLKREELLREEVVDLVKALW